MTSGASVAPRDGFGSLVCAPPCKVGGLHPPTLRRSFVKPNALPARPHVSRRSPRRLTQRLPRQCPLEGPLRERFHQRYRNAPKGAPRRLLPGLHIASPHIQG